MATQVQFRGGSSTEHNSFTGAAREVTVDTTKDTVVVHDGSTAGGHPLQKQYPALGSVSAPTYTFVGDTNTGIYSPGADQVAISTNGTGRLFVASDGRVSVGGSAIGAAVFTARAGTNQNITIKSSSSEAAFEAINDANNANVPLRFLASQYVFNTGATERLRIDSSGNVGIGTSSITGAAGTRLQIESAGSTRLNISANAASYAAIDFGDSGDRDIGRIEYYNANNAMLFWTNASERLRIDSSGNVGIGTTNPSLFGNSAKLVIQRAGSSESASCVIYGASNASSLIQFADGTGSAAERNAGFIAVNHTDQSMGFGIQDSERLRIDSSGRLLVNNTAATQSHSLQVTASSDGNAVVVNGRASDDIGELSFYENDRSTKLGEIQYRQDQVNIRHRVGDIRFATGGTTERMRIDSSGNVGIGTTQVRDSAKLAVSSGESAETISFRPGTGTANLTEMLCYNYGTNSYLPFKSIASEWRFDGPSGERARIDSSGNLLIGGTLPSAPNISLNADGSASFATDKFTIGAGGGTIINATTSAGINTVFRINSQDGTNRAVIRANGSATFAGTVTANGTVLTSDQRFKENITPADPQLADIKALGAQLKNYDWNADAPSSNGTRQLGLIAQDVEAVCPGLVKTIARTKQGAELTPEVVVPAVYETRTVPAVLDDEGKVVKAETTEQVLVTEEQITPATYEELDDSYKGISHDALIMKLLGAVAELSAKVAALEGA